MYGWLLLLLLPGLLLRQSSAAVGQPLRICLATCIRSKASTSFLLVVGGYHDFVMGGQEGLTMNGILK